MPGSLMDDDNKRLDLDAPLLSVRRFAPESESRSPAAAAARGNPKSRRTVLPFYKSDLKTGPIRDPGVVPFLWEQSPGRPKPGASLVPPAPAAPKLPPGRILIDKESANPGDAVPEDDEKKVTEAESEEARLSISAECDGEEEEKFLDALETLSRTESFFMNCSVSGLSEMPEKAEASGSFSTDVQVRDFMMGRFLPAAKAVATGLPHSSARKLPVHAREQMRVIERVGNGEQKQVRFPMNYQYGAHSGQEGEEMSCRYDDDDEEEEDYYDNGYFSSKACGLIPKFCLMNPVPGMKLPNRRLPPTSVRRVLGPQVKSVQHGSSLGQIGEEYSWEAVYKHKLTHGNAPSQRDDVSKLTSESNHLVYWSDSLTADGSSPQHQSNVGGISPYRNEPSQSPFLEGKGFLGVPRRETKDSRTDSSDSFEKDSESYWVVTPHHSSKCESGSMSPSVERILHMDNLNMPETPLSKSSSPDNSSNNKEILRSAGEHYEVGVQNRRMNENLGIETCNQDTLQSKCIEVVDIGPIACAETSAYRATNENNGFKPNNGDDNPMCLNQETKVKHDAGPTLSLLPPPLPNSPSESWLSRTLPSGSSRNSLVQSFLGVHVQPRKQASNSSLSAPKKEIPVKPLKVLRGQTRFADMLAAPLSPRSDI